MEAPAQPSPEGLDKMRKALFDSPEQAITVTFHWVQNLAVLLSWTILGCFHLALALLIALLMWWNQVTPELVRSAAHEWLASTSNAVVGAVGFSLLSLLTAYVAAIRWVWCKTFVNWQFEYLMRGVERD